MKKILAILAASALTLTAAGVYASAEAIEEEGDILEAYVTEEFREN